jgi:hypothetical protein
MANSLDGKVPTTWLELGGRLDQVVAGLLRNSVVLCGALG